VDLAQKYGLNRDTVTAVIERVKATMPPVDRAQILDQSLAILDAGLGVFIPMMLTGDKGAARIVDRYLGRRGAYLGLETPQKLELFQAQQQTRAETIDVRAELPRSWPASATAVSPMHDPVQDLTASIERLRAKGLIPPHDPAATRAQLREYLTRRGQAIAQDLDLDQATPDELAELGRLDVLGQMPGVDQDLAPTLAMVTDGWHQTLAKAQHERDHDLDQAHDHARLHETGVLLDQDHTRLQLLGHDRDAGHHQDPRPSPPGDHARAAEGSGAEPGLDGAGLVQRGVSNQKRPDRDGNYDEIKWYLENVQDPDDEHWRPTP
jgi:hypothetical protein